MNQILDLSEHEGMGLEPAFAALGTKVEEMTAAVRDWFKDD